MSSHITTLVVDYDDTIAITFNRDWENAKPNIQLISKLNDLYNQGWDIHIVTARGQISCNGDSAAADSKYRSQIEKWLKEHDVKYTSLSFNKKLAAYYIDDKGITPEQFVKEFDRVPLTSGWSGATVYYDKVTNCVYKTDKNGHSVIQWYDYASSKGISTPYIHNIIGDTIRMDCLPAYSGTTERVIETISSFGNHCALSGNTNKEDYIHRCVKRISPNFDESFINELRTLLKEAMDITPYTFGHGDCSISNIMGKSIECSDIPAFIDPINDPTLYSSWVIDIGKYYASLHLFSNIYRQQYLQRDRIFSTLHICEKTIKTHAIGHLCRVVPYAPDIEKNRIIEIIKSESYALR